MKYTVKTFENLTKEEVYEILLLRSEVFVVEQDCVYQDIDNKDQKAIHIIGRINDIICAYARIFNARDYFNTPSIGRVIVKESVRKDGYGHSLIEECLSAISIHYKTTEVTISAQQHLEKFYNKHDFITIGESYLEDGIPHVKMIRS